MNQSYSNHQVVPSGNIQLRSIGGIHRTSGPEQKPSADPIPPRALWRARLGSEAAVSVRKIPPELRRMPMQYSSIPEWHRRLLTRFKEDSQFLRSTVQLAFALLCVWIGIEFHLFVQWGQSGGSDTFAARPPGVEGFLPISALMSLSYWIQTGVINGIHPSGLFIFVAIVALGLLLKKAFCGWMCPIGTLSEALWMLGQKIFRRNLRLPLFLDYPLRALKYLLLLFFVWAIVQMSVEELKLFIYSPYNRMADVKMYLFFAELSAFSLWTILILMGLSVVIKNFWCRYLCPYGALLGAMSWLSPVKITRNEATCIDCELCSRACPSNIAVHKVSRVRSDECMGCLQCTQACPVKNTLNLRAGRSGRPIPSWVFAALGVGVFVATIGLAMLTGHWQNSISREEYMRRFQEINAPAYQHNRGEVPAYGPND